MNISDWQKFLKQESQKTIQVYLQEESQGFSRISSWKYRPMSSEAIKMEWLGKSGALEEELQAAEKRLNIILPPSYRNFLKVTNGWAERNLGYVPRLYSTDELVWFRDYNKHRIDSLICLNEEYPFSPELLDDRQYFIYGKDQYVYRPQHLQNALQISQALDEDEVIVLNPNVIHDNEWEAWLIMTADIKRWISFEAMFREIGILKF